MATFYQKNGYDVQISIGSYTITTSNQKQDNGLCDDLVVNCATNQARTAIFSFIPPETTVYLEQFQGKTVSILIRTPLDGWQQVFFGYVDTPKLDFLSRKITLECSDNRSNKVIQLPSGIVSSIGSYSNSVFGLSNDKAEELEKRLQTVAGDFDFDRFGNYELTPWLPKSSADFTFTSSDVFYGTNPTVEYTNRVKTINTINIEVNYTYQRLHHQTVSVNWPGYNDFMSDYWNQGRPSFPAKQTIIGAASGSDWKVVSPGYINFVDLWPAQGFQAGDGVVIWQPNQVTEEKKGRTQLAGYVKDSTGNFVSVGDPARLVPQYEPVLDANGNQIMDVISRTITDTSSHLCRGASWTAALRFAQSVTEKYTIQMRSPQSIAKYGIIDSFTTIDINDPYDVSLWEGSDVINFVTYNFYVDQKNNYSELSKALQVSLNKARHDILDLHRDVVVGFRTVHMKPKVDLKHTIDVTIDQSAIGSTASIHAKGKVSSVQHVVDFNTLEAYTTINLRLSRAQGSASNSVWSVPVPIENPSYIYDTLRSINLGTHLGINPDPDITPQAEKWTGWIGNKIITTSIAHNNISSQRTQYQETFIVDYPQIPDILREDIIYNSDALFNLAIPNDTLDVSF